ncbi:hypothetical protein GTA28_28220 [Rhodococcus hoagii]|nr:hypothetical protein [Prescottella equi]
MDASPWRAAAAAAWASQKAGRGKGSMIGGLIALKIGGRASLYPGDNRCDERNHPPPCALPVTPQLSRSPQQHSLSPPAQATTLLTPRPPSM